MQTKFSELTDSQWQFIQQFLPVQQAKKHDLRVIFNAILWIVRTGTQWRNLDSKYPKWQSVYYHFYRWSRNGTVDRINQALNQLVPIQAGRAPLPSLTCVDSQSVKLAVRIAKDRGTDAHNQVNGRKRQAAVDTLGLLWAVDVHAAHQADSRIGCRLWPKLIPVWQGLKKVLIDSSYRGAFTQLATRLGIATQIAAKPPSAQGFVPLKQRWVVERTFAWTNFFGRTVKDYQYTKESSEAMLLLANTTIALNRIAA